MPDFDVVTLPETSHVEEGEVAPDFTRPLVGPEYWTDRSLSDLTADGPVLLVFYPMNGSFPATYIWTEIESRSLAEQVTVAGVSVSTPYAHKRFIEDRNLSNALFSDPANVVAAEYGVEHDLDGMAGVAEPRPATFLVDEERRVEYAWVAEEWPEFPEYDEVEQAVTRVASDA